MTATTCHHRGACCTPSPTGSPGKPPSTKPDAEPATHSPTMFRQPGLDGRMGTGTETYERKGDAERALTLIEAQLLSREWTDPVGGKIKLRDYAQRWLAHRAGLRARTIELYSWLLRTHIAPYLGG